MKHGDIATTTRRAIRRIAVLGGAFAAIVLPALAVDASAQAFVTGSANTDGFSIIGRLRILRDGTTRGNFVIIVHRDVPEGSVAAAVCTYKQFDNVVIRNNVATFHSIGACQVLTTGGGRASFTSNNTFGIVDNGVPGAGHDTVDVNFTGPSGITIPGSFLVDGNFIVSP